MGIETQTTKITKLDVESDTKKQEHQRHMQEMNLKHGLLGKVFGSNENVPNYIIAIIAILLVLTGACSLFIPMSNLMTAKDLWVIIAPMLTSILGYSFGVKAKNAKNDTQNNI